MTIVSQYTFNFWITFWRLTAQTSGEFDHLEIYGKVGSRGLGVPLTHFPMRWHCEE
jgi:hypothetical protein